MAPRLVADLLLLVHFAFVLYAICGGFLVLVKPRTAWLHIPVVLWAGLVNLASWVCPLTPWEIHFRLAAGQAGYQGGFVEHYIAPLVYPAGMPRELEIMAAVSITTWNIIVYLIVIKLYRRRSTLKMERRGDHP